MKSYKNMTADDFSQIKLLVNAGLNRSTIKTITGRSNGTIDNVTRSESFEDYKALVRALYVKAPSYSKKVKQPAQATQSVTDFLNDDPLKNFPSIHKEVTEVREQEQSNELRQIEALERIADTLNRLVEAWENEPAKKRGIF